MTTANKNTQGKTSAEKTAEPKLHTVTFIKAHGRYVAGDIAGFTMEKAEQLLERKIAVEGTELPKATEQE